MGMLAAACAVARPDHQRPVRWGTVRWAAGGRHGEHLGPWHMQAGRWEHVYQAWVLPRVSVHPWGRGVVVATEGRLAAAVGTQSEAAHRHQVLPADVRRPRGAGLHTCVVVRDCVLYSAG